MICRLFLKLIHEFLLLFSNDSKVIKYAITSNCKQVYKNRLRGKTSCNPIRYYSCKWRTLFFNIPVIRHTLILDLDETLIYSCRFSDLSTMKPSLESIGITIVVLYYSSHLQLRQNKYVSFYVYKRPYLDKFLNIVCRWFNVVVFTAGEKPYADAILNVIDPRCQIRKRFYKENCQLVDGSYVKRIETVNCELGNTMLLDNNPECYRMDKSNAISITSWYGDDKDKELNNLIPFLDLMRTVEDVRSVLQLNCCAVCFRHSLYRTHMEVIEESGKYSSDLQLGQSELIMNI